MKRYFVPIAALALAAAANARPVENPRVGETTYTEEKRPSDSMRVYHVPEVEVTATRATEKTPVAYDDLDRAEIARHSYGTDIPSVLALTPSMVATNETGIGIGATSMRLRGTDATRLSVTINGVSMNNPDSHSMYWYDTPDLISAVGTIQVQRGAGISTNGTGAFGGAINMSTDAISTEFGGTASLSYGSYNTQKQAVGISSGLMGGHWAVEARLTHLASDGYVDRGATDLKSYLFQGAYYNGGTSLKLLSFGGKATTALSYTGATKEEMRLNGRRFNPEGMYTVSGGLSHRIWNSEEGDWMQVGYYDDQTDNYLQINNQLVLTQRLAERWTLNATAFYTYGYGYYKQYKDDAKLYEYGYTGDAAYGPDGSKIRRDLIREKVMRNHLGGLNAAAHYSSERLELSAGGSWSYYTCPHWGELDWVEDTEFDRSGRWYRNDVDKQDANLFARANWSAVRSLNLYADLQYRYVSYKAWGVNDNYDEKIEGMQRIDVDEQYHFFNPRVGLTWNPAPAHTFFASFAVAQKEPTRSDFTDRFRETFPRSEKLYDYEIGYRFSRPRISAGVNLYYMIYKDQLVKTGQINDSYDALNVNVPDSYRRGIELTASWRTTSWFTLSANATFSQNRIKNYTNKVTDWDGGYHETYMGTTRISYAPETIGSVFLDFHYRGFEAVLHTQYVGEQYFVNYSNPNMRLDAYCVSNLNLAYTLPMRAGRSVRFGLTVYNLFDAEYESNGYGYSQYYSLDDSPKAQHDLSYYFAQAPLHVLANVTVRF